MLITCPIDGARLIQHQSHRWPCMERSGCACPVVESCPECRARAIRAVEDSRAPGVSVVSVEKAESRAIMQRGFEARLAKLRAEKARRAEQ